MVDGAASGAVDGEYKFVIVLAVRCDVVFSNVLGLKILWRGKLRDIELRMAWWLYSSQWCKIWSIQRPGWHVFERDMKTGNIDIWS